MIPPTATGKSKSSTSRIPPLEREQPKREVKTTKRFREASTEDSEHGAETKAIKNEKKTKTESESKRAKTQQKEQPLVLDTVSDSDEDPLTPLTDSNQEIENESASSKKAENEEDSDDSIVILKSPPIRLNQSLQRKSAGRQLKTKTGNSAIKKNPSGLPRVKTQRELEEKNQPDSKRDKMSSDEGDYMYDDDDDDLMGLESGGGENDENYSETSDMEDGGQGGDLDDDDDAAYDAFDIPVGGVDSQSQKKPYEISYQIKSVAELQAEQRDLVNRVAGLVNCDYSSAATLLRFYHWNSEKLTESYWDNPSKILTDAGLSPPSSPAIAIQSLPTHLSSNSGPADSSSLNAVASSSTQRPGATRQTTSSTKNQKQEPFECPICCNDFQPEEIDDETLCMGCEHRFCKACWTEYLNQKIMEESESGRVQCMESGCSRIVSEKVVESLIEGRVAERYRELLDRTYVDDNPNLKWCPHPDCQFACYTSQAPPRKLNQIIPTVMCRCGHDFCFGCGFADDHRPLICKYVKLWEKKCADDSETSNWLMANTKECAKCASTIEKNGGCNHMTCKKCRYEFCWVCLADWSSHGTSWYNCNRFEDKQGVQARDTQAKSRASLERYLHYFNRFANHEQSAKLDQQLYKKTEKKMEDMQQRSNLTWIEVQFAKKAVDVLLAARMTLKWTYAMAFYLEKCNSTAMFEDNQANLEQAVEDLSEMLEKPIEPELIPKIREDMTNKTAFVQKRSDIILNDTLLGHWEGRWQFSAQ